VSSHTSKEKKIRLQNGVAVTKKSSAVINMRARTRAPRVSAREIAARFAQVEAEGISRSMVSKATWSFLYED